jgi:hypothetical protein
MRSIVAVAALGFGTNGVGNVGVVFAVSASKRARARS